MIIHCRLFAAARDLAGSSEVVLKLSEPATIGDVRRQLATEVPALAALAPYLLFAIGTDYATNETPVAPGSEIAGIPPVSGG